jgi:lipoyl-dependent peroxiredoxin subunit D
MSEMTLAQIGDSLPEYAKDLRVNLQNVLQQAELTPQQTWMSAIACALASRNNALSRAVEAEAEGKLPPEGIQAAKAAFAMMEMNNVFYRFKHYIGAKDEYAQVPARLRMQAIRNHGGDPVDFELACLAASAVNGCEACVRSHEDVVRQKGVSPEAVVAAARIAATMHAVAAVRESLG